MATHDGPFGQDEAADRVGLDAFGIREQLRAGFLDSASAIILATAAARTKTICLNHAVTVLSTTEPVCVFQGLANSDLISNGPAQIVEAVSFIKGYPLFGFARFRPSP